VHAPALCGWYRFDPIYLVSGLAEGTWQSNGLLPGYPWADPNAGVTTQALGALAAGDWLHLQLPWWNPYSGIGLPLAAEGQTPAFFVPFVLLLALPHGLLALRMLLMALAGLFTFALLRRLRLDLLPSLVGALIFELNGTFALFAHGPIMPVAFLPLVLLGLEQARAGSFPLATVLGVAWSFLSGFPETAALNMLLAAAWGACRLAQSPDRAGYALRAGGAAASGLLIAAPAIWPFLEALPREYLGQHTAASTAGLLPANLALLVFPTLFGNPYAAPHPPADVAAAWARTGGYICLAQMALAVAALRRRAPEFWLRVVLAGFALLTAARAALLPAAVAMFGMVPLLRQAMVHTYIIPAWSLIAAVLAATTIQDWRRHGPIPTLPAALAAGAIGIAAMVFAWPGMAALRATHLPHYQPSLTIAAGALATTAVLALIAGKPTATRQALLAAVIAAQSGALFLVPALSGTHGRRLDTRAIRFLQAHAGLGRVVSFGPLVPNYGAMFGVAQLNHNALPLPATWVRAIQPLHPGDPINFAEGALPDPARLRTLLPQFAALGATYALTWPGEAIPGAAQAYAGTAMTIWALPNTAPYAEAPGCEVHPQDRLVFTLRCRAPAHFLRRELFWPGWRATVNATPVPVRPDGIFQAIDLPPGASIVRFRYTPPFEALAWCCAWLAGALVAVAGMCRLAPRAALAEDRTRAANGAAPREIAP
jgi:hypothetical protein